MPPPARQLPIGSPYRTVREVSDSLFNLQATFVLGRDRRAVFVTAYLQVTQNLAQRIQSQYFRDNEWVTRLVIAFSNLYREALAAHEAQERSTLPKAWEIALSASAKGRGLVIQDLILGMNAHINRDLPFALTTVGLDPQRTHRHQDYRGVNEVLREVTDGIQDRIATMYAPGLRTLDAAAGRLDEIWAAFKIQLAREHAWNMGVALAGSKSAAKRTLARATIEKKASAIARLVLAPTTLSPALLEALRAVEQDQPWWEWLRK